MDLHSLLPANDPRHIPKDTIQRADSVRLQQQTYYNYNNKLILTTLDMQYNDTDTHDIEIAEIFHAEEWQEITTYNNKDVHINDVQQAFQQGFIGQHNAHKLLLVTYYALGCPSNAENQTDIREKAISHSKIIAETKGALAQIIQVISIEHPEHSASFRRALNLLLVISLNTYQCCQNLNLQLITVKLCGKHIVQFCFDVLVNFSHAPTKKLLALIRHIIMLYPYLKDKNNESSKSLTLSAQSLNSKSLKDPSRFRKNKARRSDMDALVNEISRLTPVVYSDNLRAECFEDAPAALSEGLDLMQLHMISSSQRLEQTSELDNEIDILYGALVGRFEIYAKIFTKLLISASPSAKKESFCNLRSEICSLGFWSSHQLDADLKKAWEVEYSRHKEIIAKYLSSVLLFLLKLFKKNSMINSVVYDLAKLNRFHAILAF